MKSRPIIDEDFAQFDYIVAMDAANIKGLEERLRASRVAKKPSLKYFRLLELVPERQGKANKLDVPDPYYTDKFQETYELCTEGCKLLFEQTNRTTKGKAVEMEDVKFHQCVRLSQFDKDRTISFVPPDGDFELMSYRLNTEVKPLIWVESVVESYGTRIEYMIKAKAQFKRRSMANNVEIWVPVPEDADTPKFKSTDGTVRYAPEKNCIVWTIKQFPGGKEFLMRAHFGLPSVRKEDPDKKPPISVKYEIPYFTVSGIQVRYLKIIEKSGYQALPWVRYITQNGDYELRMPEAVKANQKSADARPSDF